jgi:hypothetical protein
MKGKVIEKPSGFAGNTGVLPAFSGTRRRDARVPMSFAIKSRFFKFAVALVFAACLIQTAGADTIGLEVDVNNISGNSGEYVFTIQSDWDWTITAISIYFDYGLYKGLEYTSGLPDGWEVTYTDPYENMGPEYPGELRLYYNDSKIGLTKDDEPLVFSVSFYWLGIEITDDYSALISIKDNPFEITAYNPMSVDDSEKVFVVVNGEHIFTELAPVPEPQTFVLLGAGLVGLAAYCRRNRLRNAKRQANAD